MAFFNSFIGQIEELIPRTEYCNGTFSGALFPHLSMTCSQEPILKMCCLQGRPKLAFFIENIILKLSLLRAILIDHTCLGLEKERERERIASEGFVKKEH